MKSTDVPSMMPVPFATSGSRTDILAASLSGSNKASYPDGFPPITMLNESAGGAPPLGQNFNQILFELASAMRWANVGGLYSYDSTFSTSVGGYPAGARVIGSDNRTIYLSLEDDNTDDPTSGTGTWYNESIGQLPIGVPVPYPSSTVPTGFLACDGKSFPSTYTTLASLYPSLKTPDLRGQFIRGWDNGAGVDASRTILSSQTSQNASHTHSASTASAGTHTHSASTASSGAHTHTTGTVVTVNAGTGNTIRPDGGTSASTSSAGAHTHAVTVDSAGAHTHNISVSSSGGTESRPVNIAFNYILRAY